MCFAIRAVDAAAVAADAVTIARTAASTIAPKNAKNNEMNGGWMQTSVRPPLLFFKIPRKSARAIDSSAVFV